LKANRHRWIIALALLFVAVHVGFLYSGQQVTVTGQVEFSSSVAGQAADPSDTVVWLTPAADSPHIRSAPQARQLVQKHKTFAPHLLVVQVGTPVEFPNKDPFFHNVFSLFEGKRFDLGLYEAGSSRTVVFNRAGISYIFCNIHPEMSAVVVSLTTPYYGISDRKGLVVIPNVPSGRYEIHVWHERVLPETLNNLTRSVVISPTASSLGIFHLPEQRNLSQNHKNKYGRDYENASNGPIYTRP
jgi:plastocyanin